MITKEQFIASIRHDADVVRHLYGKVQDGMRAYRPTPKQRSLQELLEYIPCNAATIAKHVVSGDWTTIQQDLAATKEAARKDFLGTLEREVRGLEEILMQIPEQDLQGREVQMPNGMRFKLGQALLNFNLKFFSSYKMQLFLYLKGCGLEELGSTNLWRGSDAPPAKK